MRVELFDRNFVELVEARSGKARKITKDTQLIFKDKGDYDLRFKSRVVGLFNYDGENVIFSSSELEETQISVLPVKGEDWSEWYFLEKTGRQDRLAFKVRTG